MDDMTENTESVTPTITESDRLAGEIIEMINAIAERIPRLEMPHPSKSHVRGARTVSREFIISMIATAEEHPELQESAGFDIDEANEMLQFNDAFKVVRDKLAALLAGVNYTMEARKAPVAAAAMRAYTVAKGLARDLGGAPLVHHLEVLRRDLARRNGRRKVARTGAPAEPE